MGRPRNSIAAFWPKVDMSGGVLSCWPWLRCLDKDGYGQFSYYDEDGIEHKDRAHRVALEQYLGRRLRPGMMSLHKCDNPPCCNPRHLYEGTNAMNMADCWRKGRGSASLCHRPVKPFTPFEVKAIRTAYATKRYTYRMLAKQYRCSATSIWQVVKFKVYANRHSLSSK